MRRVFYSGVVIPNIKTAQQDAPVQQCLIRNSKNKLVAGASTRRTLLNNVLKIHFKGLDIFTRVSRKFSSAGDDVASAESALPIRRRPWKPKDWSNMGGDFSTFLENRHIHDSREIKTKEDKTKGVFQAFFFGGRKRFLTKFLITS